MSYLRRRGQFLKMIRKTLLYWQRLFTSLARLNKSLMLELLWSWYKFGGMIEVSRESRGGCVVVLWKKDLDFFVNTFSPNHIDVIVNKEKEDEWRFMGVLWQTRYR